MLYQEFVRVVKEEMNRELRGGAKASIYKAVKNNGKEKQGIIIETSGINISPTIYLEEFYEAYRTGKPLKEIIIEIVNFYEKVKCKKPWNPKEIENYASIGRKVVFKLINTEKNRELLSLVPHIDILDLSLVFYVLLEVTRDGSATMLIYNEHLTRWNVNMERIWKDAQRNVMQLLPAKFYTMRSILETDTTDEICMGDREEKNLLQGGYIEYDSMYVLSNTIRNLGAACIIYPQILEMVGDILQEDYYILPSSIHEVIIVPVSKGLVPEEMNRMVKEINETQVLDEEVLSNHAYIYERTKKKLKGCSLQSAGIMLG